MPLTSAVVPLVEEGSSQPAAPLSSEATKTLMPCAAACCQSEFQNWFPARPIADSQLPKLTLTIGARFWFTTYCADSETPSVVALDFDTTTWINAFGAIAPDHSVSNSTSPCSSVESTPGSEPLTMTVGSFTPRPRLVRNAETSAIFRLLRATIAIDSPNPFVELPYSG